MHHTTDLFFTWLTMSGLLASCVRQDGDISKNPLSHVFHYSIKNSISIFYTKKMLFNKRSWNWNMQSTNFYSLICIFCENNEKDTFMVYLMVCLFIYFRMTLNLFIYRDQYKYENKSPVLWWISDLK